MMPIRALVTLRLVSDAKTVAAVMKRVADYTKEHFGDDLRFEPFIDDESGTTHVLQPGPDSGGRPHFPQPGHPWRAREGLQLNEAAARRRSSESPLASTRASRDAIMHPGTRQ
jgi:hypothetical protein